MRAKKTIKVGRVPRPGVPLWLLCSLLFALCALRSPAAGFVREDGRYSVTNIGGTTVKLNYAGLEGGTAGLDQFVMQLPRSLAGQGTVSMSVAAGGMTSNTVNIAVR